eukprot:TRINITY_DN5215_c0_g1_i10.p1 TRINITY_DN5215_c0_g1~~TRINITY_DN5215_c0_g1_i10.p1  ORF type:complete len:230 (-),score=20.81 TRINITY_DN5215_c0_g1_i10:61-750(-)
MSNPADMMGAAAAPPPMGGMLGGNMMDKMGAGPMGGQASNNYTPPEDHNLNYYQEYCRLFIANVVLTTQMKELVSEKNELLAKLGRLEMTTSQYTGGNAGLDPNDDKKRRFRRTATEIDRHYRCPVDPCQKSYGSEGSLNQHIKIKHPDYHAQMSVGSNSSALKPPKGSKSKDEADQKKQCMHCLQDSSTDFQAFKVKTEGILVSLQIPKISKDNKACEYFYRLSLIHI